MQRQPERGARAARGSDRCATRRARNSRRARGHQPHAPGLTRTAPVEFGRYRSPDQRKTRLLRLRLSVVVVLVPRRPCRAHPTSLEKRIGVAGGFPSGTTISRAASRADCPSDVSVLSVRIGRIRFPIGDLVYALIMFFLVALVVCLVVVLAGQQADGPLQAPATASTDEGPPGMHE